MADAKLSSYPVVTNILDTDIIPIVRTINSSTKSNNIITGNTLKSLLSTHFTVSEVTRDSETYDVGILYSMVVPHNINLVGAKVSTINSQTTGDVQEFVLKVNGSDVAIMNINLSSLYSDTISINTLLEDGDNIALYCTQTGNVSTGLKLYLVWSV